MIKRGLALAAVTALTVAGLNSSQVVAGHGDVTQISATPRTVTSRFSLTVNSGVLAISPDGNTTIYENPGNALSVTADPAGLATVGAISHNAAISAKQTLSTTSAVSGVAPSAPGPTLVVVDPQHSTDTSPTPSAGTAQAARYLPVILVHGTWGSTAREFAPTLLPALAAAGIQAFTYDYGRIPWLPINLVEPYDAGGEVPVQQSTQRLSEEITRVLNVTGAPQVNLVGASQGGLVIKNYLAQASGDSVANVVDINATNHGTTLGGIAKLIDPAIVDEAFAPIHTVITSATQSAKDLLGHAGPLQVLQSPVALVGSAAHVAVDVAQAAVRVVVTVIQRVVRVGLSLAMGPAGVQQAVGSDFLNRLNKTPDTRPGVNYLVLGSKNDTTATPYESTFLKAGPGSAVFNVEEHSLPGAKPTDVIKHVDTPQPVVDAIVRFLIAADTNPHIDFKIDRSRGVTATQDSGNTTVRSGENNVLYQGTSSNGAAIKQAIGQAIDAAATSGGTPLTPTKPTAPASTAETDKTLATAKASSSLNVLAAAAPKIPAPQSAAAADAGTNSAASSNRATAQTQTAKTSDTSPNTQARQRTNIGAISSGDHSPTAPESKESAATIASTATSGTSATKSDKTSQVNAKGSPAIAEPKTSVAKADMHHTDAAASKPDNTAPRTKGASTSAEHSSPGESSRAGQSSAGSAHERTARRSKTARSSE
ncbi:Putative triacylglycerol lipase precursor [Mycobacteroides abscessus subsp. massiliense]|uniref:Putative triacylglycerol lipase n=1 Tax=Mycobacteroides abscessus subsp. massiliense TaxID=1962118 RepID=A0A1T9JAT3_9MYCO|nr:putative triacylglycerol lipase precursor [Mycobacteroides abscessus subsp. massiliense CCUG 48898 = JCM 15300]ORA86633.1 triacylglycerol lipase [Mycobacteroides abscessus subsp. massiliense]CPX25209.1 Putative triacylglycerol lipase precursor [Mycobacteroides abscessus]SKD30922.1 Putative triacylglycerol lipase precursor [Mycobacteroides abscessus subsp. massiliense]SKD31356.1 Putative triacylglycerol lipase precursor [Mycobacteroides abscessus subsp. massiliense]